MKIKYLFLYNLKVVAKMVSAKHQHQTHGVHQPPKHGENARPSEGKQHGSSGVDNQADYAHSPPKGCCSATARPVGVQRCVIVVTSKTALFRDQYIMHGSVQYNDC